MTGDADALIASWRQRGAAAIAAGDTAAAVAVLREAAALPADGITPATAAAGRGLGALAGELIQLPEPSLVQAVFQRALATFQRAPDTTIGDVLATWNNLAALYERYGAVDGRNQVHGIIGGIAEQYDGPLDTTAATVFIQLGELHRRERNHPAMLAAYRQVQRFMMDTVDLPDETRAAWLGRFADGLTEAGRDEELETTVEQARRRLQAVAPPLPLSLARCAAILASRRSSRRDFRGAAEALDAVLDLAGLPENERTEALSWAGRSWYKAGEFDRASARFMQAVRRRAGLPDRSPR